MAFRRGRWFHGSNKRTLVTQLQQEDAGSTALARGRGYVAGLRESGGRRREAPMFTGAMSEVAVNAAPLVTDDATKEPHESGFISSDEWMDKLDGFGG